MKFKPHTNVYSGLIWLSCLLSLVCSYNMAVGLEPLSVAQQGYPPVCSAWHGKVSATWTVLMHTACPQQYG